MASDEEKEAGVPEIEESKHEVKIKTQTEEKIVEAKKERTLSQLEIVLVILLALVVGSILAYILPRLIEKYRAPPEVQYYPHYVPFMPPPPVRPARRRHRKAGADIDPRMLLRTPEPLRRHGIYLDEQGECVLSSPSVFETWSIIRDELGNIVDAHKTRDEE
jgi:hypothetical protein